MQTLDFDTFATRYCETQLSTPEKLWNSLNIHRDRYEPDGWVLLQCIVLDSSRLGELTIAPVGPQNTWTEIPTKPVSPRGSCSDISEVIAFLPVANLPKEWTSKNG